jgi:hypothetical protein
MRPFAIFSVCIVCGIAAAALLAGCADPSGPVTGNTQDENLIRNSSFEFDGAASLEGWTAEDTARIAFSDDVPDGGGTWSIEIEAGTVPETYTVLSAIPAPEQPHQYLFAFWAKRLGPDGLVRLWVKSPDVNKIVRLIGVSSSYWIQYVTYFTLSTQPGDTIFVELEGGSSEVLAGTVAYDLVTLIKLD